MKLQSIPALGNPVTKRSILAALHKGDLADIADVNSGSTDAPTINAILTALRELGLIVNPFGPELVGDGGFDDPAYWTAEAGWAVSGGQAVGTAVTGYLSHPTSDPIVIGATYQYRFTVSGHSAGSVAAYLGSIATAKSPDVSADGTYTGTFVADSAGAFGLRAPDGFTGSVDNLSIKQVL